MVMGTKKTAGIFISLAQIIIIIKLIILILTLNDGLTG